MLGRVLDVVFPRRCAGCGERRLAVLRGLCRGALDRSRRRGARGAGCRRPSARPDLPRLSARGARRRPRGLPVRGSGPAGDPPAEVQRAGAAWRRRSARAMAATEPPAGRRRDLGAAGPSPARRARVRPGAGSSPWRSRTGAGPARVRGCSGVRSPPVRRRAGRPRNGAAAMRGAFQPRRASLSRPGAARRRRAHDRRDGGRVRRGAPRGGREIGVPARRRRRRRARRRGPRPAADAAYTRPGSRPGLWLPGDRSPVVDASRGRNDPRKATLGR